MQAPSDICLCGDYRSDHPNNGACRMNGPSDLCHGYRDCLEFRLDTIATKALAQPPGEEQAAAESEGEQP